MGSFSSRACARFAAWAAIATWTARAGAQQPAQGFALDRLYLSAPGGGWVVMDTLDMHGGLGGAMSLTTEYARDPLRVQAADGSQHLTVVSDEAIADFGFAASYDRYRVYLNLALPLTVAGNDGTLGGYQYAAPKNAGQTLTPSGVNLGTAPDAFADARVGVDARLLGKQNGGFRLGASAQLLAPSPNTLQSEYLTDGTFRAMLRLLFAGDVGALCYAGQIGVHIRPLDATPTPGGPEGSELLFGAAAGWRAAVGERKDLALVVGPEVFGDSAFRSFFGKATTGVEGLLTGRVEGTADDGPQLRVKASAGGGLDAEFGTPEWRVVLGIEVFDHGSDRDGDGISDRKDACPDVPGEWTDDPRTRGCPAAPAATKNPPPNPGPSCPEGSAGSGCAEPPAGGPLPAPR